MTLTNGNVAPAGFKRSYQSKRSDLEKPAGTSEVISTNTVSENSTKYMARSTSFQQMFFAAGESLLNAFDSTAEILEESALAAGDRALEHLKEEPCYANQESLPLVVEGHIAEDAEKEMTKR